MGQQCVWLKDYGTKSQDYAVGWRLFCERRLEEDNLFPKTLRRINALAQRDFEFCASLRTEDSARRLAAYKEYLASEVLPLYSRDNDLAAEFGQAGTEDEMRPIFPQLLIEGILDHLSFAEAEFRAPHSGPHTSALQDCLSELTDPGGMQKNPKMSKRTPTDANSSCGLESRHST